MKPTRVDIDDCPECGDLMTAAGVINDHGFPVVFDGAKAKCMGCGETRGVSVDEDGDCWLQDKVTP